MANPDLAPGALAKCPSGLSRHQAQLEADRVMERHWDAVKRDVEKRDGDSCRICGRKCAFNATDRKHKADPHHLIFQSANGPDESWNVIKICRSCHDDIHVHRTLHPEGNADTRDEIGNGMVAVQRLTDAGWETVRWV